MRLNVKAFALTCGILWGVLLFCITWWIILWDGPGVGVPFLGKIYRGYSITPLGSLFGLIWGLVDGLIIGLIFAWFYNLIARSDR